MEKDGQDRRHQAELTLDSSRQNAGHGLRFVFPERAGSLQEAACDLSGWSALISARKVSTGIDARCSTRLASLGRGSATLGPRGGARSSRSGGIIQSCEVYFYEIAKRLNIDTLARYAKSFGLGEQTGIPLEGEVSGIVPDTAWKMNTKKEKWYAGESLNTAIGQGYLAVTPIQMARLMAAVANGGKVCKPYLVKDGKENAKIRNEVKLRPENIEFMKKALVGVVEGGTGTAAKSGIVSIGGKPGTAQVVGEDKGAFGAQYKDHAWFVAFAPQYNPQIAVAVFVEHGGHGGTPAAAIAKKAIDAYFLPDDRKKELLNVQN